MASRFVRVDSIKQARELLELGLLYENVMFSDGKPEYWPADKDTPSQLDALEEGICPNWPLSDYTYLLED